MKVFTNIVLVVLVLLAASSGISKIMLLPQEVQFFGEYGFTNSLLITFGALQLLGGLLLIFPAVRIVGAVIVSVTFLISAFVLVISGNFPVAVITVVFVCLAGLTIKQTISAKNSY